MADTPNPSEVVKLLAQAKVELDNSTALLREAETFVSAQATRIAELESEMRRIAEGNLGDAPWQANYDCIRDVARASLTMKGQS